MPNIKYITLRDIALETFLPPPVVLCVTIVGDEHIQGRNYSNWFHVCIKNTRVKPVCISCKCLVDSVYNLSGYKLFRIQRLFPFLAISSRLSKLFLVAQPLRLLHDCVVLQRVPSEWKWVWHSYRGWCNFEPPRKTSPLENEAINLIQVTPG